MKNAIKLSKCCHYPVAEYSNNSYYCWLCDDVISESQVEEIPVRELWGEFGDIPMDPETECIEESWLTFPAGTHREEIWHWFEDTFGVSVAEGLMGCEDESHSGDGDERKAAADSDAENIELTRGEIQTIEKALLAKVHSLSHIITCYDLSASREERLRVELVEYRALIAKLRNPERYE